MRGPVTTHVQVPLQGHANEDERMHAHSHKQTAGAATATPEKAVCRRWTRWGRQRRTAWGGETQGVRHRRNSNPRATRIGFLEGIGFEETVWVDTRRFSGGNRWLDDGSQETQQRSGSNEEKTSRDDRERIWERCKNGRRFHGWSGWFSVVVRVQTRILQAISEWKRPVEGKEFGSVECGDRTGVSESVELETWLVCRMIPTDIFLSQISMLTDWDVLMLQECFRKLDWVNVGAHEMFTCARTLGRIAMPGSHRQSEMMRTIED